MFERRSRIAHYLTELGGSVDVVPLPSGDLDVGGETLVERKTVLDLHSAIVRNRFWPQLGRIRYASRYPFLLVEGTNLDDGPIDPRAIRGACLAAQRLGVRLIQTVDASDSALWLYLLAKQRQRPKAATPPRH